MKKLLPGVMLAIALGTVGLWAMLAGQGGFPKFNRYFHPDEYLAEVERAMAKNIPFAKELEDLAVQKKSFFQQYMQVRIREVQ